MFIEFTVSNYLSFRDEVCFSLVAGKKKSQSKVLDKDATFELRPDLKLLKCAVLYGANASGKSNLFAAVAFMRTFVLNSSKESQSDEAIPVRPFLLQEGLTLQPSSFSITFAIEDVVYSYSFSATSTRIVSEELSSLKGKKETTLFSRSEQKISLSKAFAEGNLLDAKTRENALFLSVCANFDGKISRAILRWFRRIHVISGLEDMGLLPYTRQCLATDHENHSHVQELIKSFGLGIRRFELGEEEPTFTIPSDAPAEIRRVASAILKAEKKKGPLPRRIMSFHPMFDSSGNEVGEIGLDLAADESEGTQKLVALSGPLVDTLKSADILFIDEFDARLHPILSHNILKQFNSTTANPNNAQLIVATHDTNMLDRDLLRRDQIWFCEKDKYGSSHLTSLVEYKVRNDASFEKDYIMGKYGAIPMLSNNIYRIMLSDAMKEAPNSEEKHDGL